jgi:hypothetical protein
MEINGLPLHPLVVHAAVIFGPLSAILAIVYVVVPRWRDRLRWVTLGAVLLATAAIWAAYLSGDSFLESDQFSGLSGELLEKIEHHEDLAGTLRLVTTGFAIVTIAATVLHRRPGVVRYVLGALVAVGAVGTLVYTVLTGDAGAQAVWGA